MRIAMNRVWSLAMASKVSQAQGALNTLLVRARALEPEQRAPILAELGVLKAILLALCGRYEALETKASLFCDVSVAGVVSCIAPSVRRLACWKQGDLGGFHAIQPVRGVTGQSVDAAVLAFDRAMEAAVELQQLRLAVAARLARESRSVERGARHDSPTRSFGEIVLAEVLFEQGEISDAETLVRDHLHRIRERGCAEVALRLYGLLARIAVHRGNGDLAVFLLRDGVLLGESRGWDRMIAVCLQQEIEVLVRAGRIDEAGLRLDEMIARWPNENEASEASTAMPVLLAQCRVWLATGRALDSVAVLTRAWQVAVARGDLYLSVQLQIRAAEALARCGRRREAVEVLLGALEIGAGVGLHQSFVSAGADILRLIVEALASLSGGLQGRHFLQPYLNSLLGTVDAPGADAHDVALRGPLSFREHTILKLMRHGSSNKRIARELGITPETVKTHAKRIFIKLGAQTRLEAVTRASSLSLI